MARPSPAPHAGAPAASPTREQRLVLWIAILASFVAFLDGTVVNVALPAILRGFHGDLTLQQWVVDAYLITLGALILVAGSVSDVYGRIRVLRVGLVAFGATSLAVALAPTATALILARLLQGAAGALLVPSSLALIMSAYSGAAQARAIGVWTSVTSAAMIVGPVLGGAAVDLASWRLAFGINVLPIAAALILLARLGRRDAHLADTSIDFPGALLCAVGLGGIAFALIEGRTRGWADPVIVATAAVGAASTAAFLLREARARQPMMPLALFRARNFAWGNAATLLVYAGLSLVSFLSGIYLQQGAGLTATAAGLALLPVVLMMALLSARIGALAGRLGPRLFMTVGPLTMAAGTLLLLLVREDFAYWTQVLPGVALIGLGLSLTVSPLTSAVLGAIETSRSGIASAINNAVARIAGLIAIALIGTIVGGSLNLAGFDRALVFTAALLALGGVVSLIGIRNAERAPS